MAAAQPLPRSVHPNVGPTVAGVTQMPKPMVSARLQGPGGQRVWTGRRGQEGQAEQVPAAIPLWWRNFAPVMLGCGEEPPELRQQQARGSLPTTALQIWGSPQSILDPPAISPFHILVLSEIRLLPCSATHCYSPGTLSGPLPYAPYCSRGEGSDPTVRGTDNSLHMVSDLLDGLSLPSPQPLLLPPPPCRHLCSEHPVVLLSSGSPGLPAMPNPLV